MSSDRRKRPTRNLRTPTAAIHDPVDNASSSAEQNIDPPDSKTTTQQLPQDTEPNRPRLGSSPTSDKREQQASAADGAASSPSGLPEAAAAPAGGESWAYPNLEQPIEVQPPALRNGGLLTARLSLTSSHQCDDVDW